MLVAGVMGVMATANALDLPRPTALALGIDEITALDFEGTAGTVVVANPSVVEAIVQDGTGAILQGRMPGVTDLLVQDADGAVLGLWRIRVAGSRASSLVVYRGRDRETLFCDPVCAPGATPGDAPAAFAGAADQAKSRLELAGDAAEAQAAPEGLSVE